MKIQGRSRTRGQFPRSDLPSRKLPPKIGRNCMSRSQKIRRVTSAPWPRYFWKSIAIHLPFLSRYFGKSMPSSWQNVLYTPPICITIRLPFVSRYFFRSIRVRGRWNTPKKIREDFSWMVQIFRQVFREEKDLGQPTACYSPYGLPIRDSTIRSHEIPFSCGNWNPSHP